MRGQFGLRPPARQNGRLLTLFLTPFWRTLPHRPGEVVLGDLQVVLRSDRLRVIDPAPDAKGAWFGSGGLNAGAGVGWGD